MPDSSFVQTSFLGGEWSPASSGRSDSKRYDTAMARSLNGFPTEEGSWTRRSGFKFVAMTKAGSAARLIPFEYSETDAYQIEAGGGYMRFVSDYAMVTNDAVVVSSISTATPAVVTTSSAHGFTSNKYCLFDTLVGGHLLRNRQFIVQVLTSTTFSIADPILGSMDGTTLTDFTSANVAQIHEVTTTYTAADVLELGYAQEENELLLFHAERNVHTLNRDSTSPDVFSITEADLIDGPYMDDNVTSTTLTPGGTSGSISITASSTTGINGGDGFQTTDVGRLVRIQDSAGNWTWVEFTGHSSTTIMTALIKGAALADTTARTTWRLGLYSNTTGFPKFGVFHENRLWLAGVQVNRLDASKSALRFDFSPTSADGTVADDNAVAVVVNSQVKNDVTWLATDERGLLAGTLGGEWLVRASTLDDPIAPTNIQARQVSEYGGARVRPVRAGTSLVFAHKRKRKLHEMARFEGQGGFYAPNLSEASRHLTKTGIDELAYQSMPTPIIWGRRDDGHLIGLSYKRDPDQFYAAAHEHIIGAGSEESAIESISTGPSGDGLSEDLWAIQGRIVDALDDTTGEGGSDVDITKVIVMTAGVTFSVPADWNNSDNFIYCIGGGQGGETGLNAVDGGGDGGDGGDFAQVTNAVLLGGSTVSINIGTGGTGGISPNDGTDTWIKDNGGTQIALAPGGGSATGAVGSVTNAGGAGGGGGDNGGSGGGGAAGPNGVGGTGEDVGGTVNDNPGGGGGGNGGGYDAGGSGSNLPNFWPLNLDGYGGENFDGVGGGRYTSTPDGSFPEDGVLGGGGGGGLNGSFGNTSFAGANGGDGAEWEDTDTAEIAGSGGGAGGGGGLPGLFGASTGGDGGDGGLYGGGGGGGGAADVIDPAGAGGDGSDGVIVMVYTVTGSSGGGLGVPDDGRVRYIEYMTPLFDDDSVMEEAFFVDGGRVVTDDPNGYTQSGVNEATLYGMYYLEGETVTVMIGGANMGTFTVSGGKIIVPDLPSDLSLNVVTPPTVIVGYSYISRGQLLRPPTGGQNGPAFGKIRRVDNYAVLLHRSGPLKFGTDFNGTMYSTSFINARESLGVDGLFSGVYADTLENDYSHDGQIAWEYDSPVPGLILSVGGFIKVNDI